MRRILAVASTTTLTLGLIVGVAPTASAAASPSSVTVGGSNSEPTTLTSSTIEAEVGDTFILLNGTAGSTGFFVRNGSGGVSSAGANCGTSTSCQVLLNVPSITLTVTAIGTLEVRANGTSAAATLTITDASRGVSTDPAQVYPTATIDANGGTCTGTAQWIKAPGQNASGGTLIAPSASSCTRTNYSLRGWALSATATTSAFAASSTVPIGDESFTLYAVWSPTGVEIRYNANVGTTDQCIQGGVNVVRDARQSAAVVLPVAGAVASAAPCTPIDAQLAGWALTGDGPSVVAPGAVLPSSFVQGSSHVLYAKWQVTYGVTSSAQALTVRPGETVSVTFTATLNGAPAAGRSVEVAGLGASIATSSESRPAANVTATTSGTGQVTVTVTPTGVGAGSVTLRFGNASAVVPVTVTQQRSIVILGDRGLVAGKPGISIDGGTTGFVAGARVVPYIRFPGMTSYEAGSARPEVGADGSFFWERKTGKKTYVYFTSQDGSVTSNRVIIPAR